MKRIKQEIEWFAAHKAEYIFCADANFGILERDLEIARYVVDVKELTGYPLIQDPKFKKDLIKVVDNKPAVNKSKIKNFWFGKHSGKH